MAPQHLPVRFNLRGLCSPVVDQGTIGSCTANAIGSGLLEYLQLRAKRALVPVSRLFLYYEERKAEGTIGTDAGACIRDGMQVCQQEGCAPEADWMYDITKFTEAPPQQAYVDAGKIKISSYSRVQDLLFAKASIAEGFPVVLGINVFESFETSAVASHGVVPMPGGQEQCLGGHAVLAVGYDDYYKALCVRNSWGTGWGDAGYFYLPYDYWTAGNVTDAWTATTLI
jgi:C1A family cysteine protease